MRFPEYSGVVPETASPLTLTESDVQQLRRWSSAFGTPQQVALRCRIVLAAAEGKSDYEIATQLNANRKTIFISLGIAIAAACVFIFEGIYQEAKSVAIAKLNQQQMIYARQAAGGIEEFFAAWTRNLNVLSQMNSVVADDRGCAER